MLPMCCPMFCLEVSKSSANCCWFIQTDPSRAYKETAVLPRLPHQYDCRLTIWYECAAPRHRETKHHVAE